VTTVEELAQSVVAAEQRVDLEVVVGVVAVIGRRGEDRCQVQRRYPEVAEIVEVLDDTEQITALEPKRSRGNVPRLEPARLSDARRRGEAVRKDLVEDRVGNPAGRFVDRRQDGSEVT
jgi:hypothetical protein